MTNHLGHVYGVFDQTGTRVESHAYSPYGAISGDDLSVQPFGMSTKRSDFASGLVYFGYRFYVPHLGRWLNRDPLQEQGGINLYGYVHGDPLGYVDPDGRYAIWVARGVAAAVGAGSNYLIQAGFYYAAHGFWSPWDCVDGYSMLESAGLGALGVGKSAKVPKGGSGQQVGSMIKTDGSTTASAIKAKAESVGFKSTQTANGPLKMVDENGVARVTIKGGSQRAPGNAGPHVELKTSSGQRVNPAGNPVTRKSPENHTPIDFDL